MQYSNSNWTDKGETAIDIGAGGKGPVFIISKTFHEDDMKGHLIKFYD